MAPSKIALGQNLSVDAIGYGAMSIGNAYGHIDEEDALTLLHDIVDTGITFFDTANIYGDGRSEELIGRFLRDRRDDVVLATKVGIVRGGGVGQRGIRGDRAYIREQLELSLRRLGTDHVDLYYQHRVDPEIPIEDTVGAFAELVEEGKILNVGLSEATGEEIRRAHAVHPIAAVQSEWSLFSRDVEVHVIPACVELGVGFVSFASVGRGMLASGFDPTAIGEGDVRRNFPRFDSGTLTANLKLVAEIDPIAERHGVPREAIALAWLFERAAELGLDHTTIPGTRFLDHLRSNLLAFDVTLEADDRTVLDGLADRVHGARTRDPRWVSGGREGLL